MSRRREVDDSIAATVSLMKDKGCVKCPRCRKEGYHDLNHDYLCNRCIAVLLSEFKDHPSVPLILENLKQRNLTPEDNPVYSGKTIK